MIRFFTVSVSTAEGRILHRVHFQVDFGILQWSIDRSLARFWKKTETWIFGACIELSRIYFVAVFNWQFDF